MRLRSGLRVGSEANEADMEDNHSTKAEWGTPHTASFSTTESQQPSASPPEAGPGQSLPSGQHYHPSDPGSHMDFILYGLVEEQYADGEAPQEQMPGQPFQPAPSPGLPQQQPAEAFSSYPGLSQLHFPQNGHTPPQTTGHQQVGDADSIELWPDPAPWSPVLATEASVNPQPGIRAPHPTDRNYSDKLEEDLDELGKEPGTGFDEDEGDPKKKHGKKVKKRRRHHSGSRGSGRDKRGRGGGGGGGGGISHGIRA